MAKIFQILAKIQLNKHIIRTRHHSNLQTIPIERESDA